MRIEKKIREKNLKKIYNIIYINDNKEEKKSI